VSAITHGSLFTGIGGFDLGFEQAGIETRWQCEIEPKRRKVLAHHWSDIPRYQDVTRLDGATLDPVDVITFGSPCQDLSVAGTRTGLDGTKSSLFYEAVRVIREMRHATTGTSPRLAVWENVCGAFSSNAGRDFGAVLDALADIGAVDICWRVLDAQWFGVAQRRRRVFVVADLGGERAGEVLAVAQGLQGGPRPCREAGQVASALTSSGVGAGGGPDDNAAQAQHLVPCLTDPTRLDDQASGHLVAQTFAYHVQGSPHTQIVDQPELARTLTTYPLAVHARQDPISSADVTPPLDTDGTSLAVAFNLAQLTHPENRSNPRPGDPAPTLVAGGSAAVAEATTVRRLTPTECERLQGFPDGWTVAAGADNGRYAALGDAVCANVAAWIGRNIITALREVQP